MNPFVYIFGFLCLLVVVSLAWRIFSHRQSLPCPSWLQWMVEMENPFTEVSRAEVIISHLGLKPGMKVLDAGCGPGRLAIPCARAVGPQGELTALDVQIGMLTRTEEKARAARLTNIRFLKAGLGEGKLEKDCYDRALMVTVLGEIPDQAAAMKEVFTALKPGGILSITEIIFDPHFQSRDSVLRVAKAAGFKEKNFYGKRLAYTLHLEK